MRRQSKALSIAVLSGALALSTVLVAIPAMAGTSSVTWDYPTGVRIDPFPEVDIATLTHTDLVGSECTVDVEATNGRSVHDGLNLNVYLNGEPLTSLEGIEDEAYKESSGSAGFVSSGSDQLVVSIESTKGERVASSAGSLTVNCTEPPQGGEGCTPGYWKQPQHEDSWVAFAPGDEFDVVFGVPYDKTLLEALETGGGKEKALGRHAVAGLLNAASPDVSYAFTQAQVIALVQSAWATGDYNAAKDLLEYENEQGCPLN